MPYRKILADNVLEFRAREDITQEELSFRSDISKETISLIERQRANATLDVLTKLASYMGLTIPELLTEGFVVQNVICNNQGGKRQKKESVKERLTYRNAMRVKEVILLRNGTCFPVCPRCKCTLEVEYQSYCDRCGQNLKWNKFDRVKTIQINKYPDLADNVELIFDL